MKYLLDTHSVTNDLRSFVKEKGVFYILREVLDESSTFDEYDLRTSGIGIIETAIPTLKKLQEVMSVHGDNVKLISLGDCSGTADVLMIAYVLSELSAQQLKLFDPVVWTIVTRDVTLTEIAKSYGIACLTGEKLVQFLSSV